MSQDPTPQTALIIVAAYKANPTWIAETLASIHNQAPLAGWTYRLAIGVDGCPETSDVLADLGYQHWVSRQNFGPYVIRNSLAALADWDALLTFDADDIMSPRYVRTLLQKLRVADIAGPDRTPIAQDGSRTSKRHYAYAHGVSAYSRRSWGILGGFRDWRVSGDWDYVQRAKAAGLRVVRHARPLYYRRHHPGQLTAQEDIGLRTAYREELKQIGKAEIAAGRLYVQPVVTDLTWRAANG
jgi:hypothetical protein